MLMIDAYMLSTLKKTDSLHNYGDYEYSNLGVGLLGYILQKKEKASYEQLLQRFICKPMGLKHTTSISDTNSRQLAKGYAGKSRAPFINLCTSMQGAGAITSSITDMMRFIAAQLDGNATLNEALAISHKKYYSEEGFNMSMGWHVFKKYGAEFYTMRGDTYGASSNMMFDKEHDLGLVVLLNSANSGVVSATGNTILAKLLDTSTTMNNFAKPEIMVDANILSSYIGTYELEHGFDAMVSVENGRLVVQLTGQPKSAFKAVGNNWFVFEKYNCQLEFNQDEKGVCNEFFLYQNETKISCKRK
jgi:CubicO group peptidase (beta-lactamase class C family)